jgi:4-amino-4-deoxy-L-arabinose transferase-like glycosyltransferase
MSHKAFLGGGARDWLYQASSRVDWWWGLGFLSAAFLLLSVNLGALPLRDWDEALVAQVAREISRAAPDSLTWLFPTLGGEPYFNKPPLMHLLIAAMYHWGGVNEWTTRLPGAMLTAISVPLLYAVGRELFHRRTPAIFAALVYLTSLPVVRQGRLAMLDGAILCFLLLLMWCLLRSRRDSRYALGVGLGLGLICLTKGLMVGVLVGAIALVFLLWDTPRLLRLPYLWGGIVLGSLPVALWYAAQWQQYGASFLTSNLGEQSFWRIWTSVENNGGPPWYYLLEILKYGFPWVLFLPLASRLTWENRNLSWAKLVLVWVGIYFTAISLMATKLPWYVLPLYPALALAIGAQLAALWQKGKHPGMIQAANSAYSRLWVVTFALLALVSCAGSLYFAMGAQPETDLAVLLAAIAMTLIVAAILVTRRDPEFLAVLVWGSYVSLLLLMLSPYWLWELGEAYPVKSVAAIVQQNTPSGASIYTSYPYSRPSLNFYSDRAVIPVDEANRVRQLRKRWREDTPPYLLLDPATLQSLNLPGQEILGSAEGWTLVTRSR